MILQDLREKQRKSRNDLAKELGYSVHTIRAWERGVRVPQVEVLKPYAKALRITLEQLIDAIMTTLKENEK